MWFLGTYTVKNLRKQIIISKKKKKTFEIVFSPLTKNQVFNFFYSTLVYFVTDVNLFG